MIKLIEKIEGEAKLDFEFDHGVISHTKIVFPTSRYVEKILQNKSAQDALVINPRVCGICGHAHLIATVQALEDCFEDIQISSKAKIVRELTLNFELVQNHFKWLYLVVFPLLGLKQELKKAIIPSQLMAKAIATVGGQYPHNSYAIIGGITSEILPSDLVQLNHILNDTLQFYQQNIANVKFENFLACENIENIEKTVGDLSTIMKLMKDKKLHEIGKSFDRFIVFGENSYFKRGKSHATRVTKKLDFHFVQEQINEDSMAKNVTYKDKYYEVGPLARAMIKKTPLIKDAHRRYSDSVFSRIVARVCEIAQLLVHSQKLLNQIDIFEPSYIQPQQPLQEISSSGISMVEAARGSLIHQVQLHHGKINNYQIITPTQWNLSNGTLKNPATAQKAMNGLSDMNTAQIVFKSFDVCSVCTTH
ncbi:MAG: nickel-dependent hydrogenase large subunit [Campylobacterales bacterium]|nr:nickel-dependent hydrogenase large subunit [Campylobacterales bacterium]